MARASWMLLCRSTAVDTIDKKTLSIDHVINEVKITLPHPLAAGDTINIGNFEAQLVTLWRRSNLTKGEKVTVRYAWGRKNGMKVNPIESTVDLRESANNQHIITIHGMAFDEPGEYQIRAQLKQTKSGKTRWNTVATLPIDVKFTAAST